MPMAKRRNLRQYPNKKPKKPVKKMRPPGLGRVPCEGVSPSKILYNQGELLKILLFLQKGCAHPIRQAACPLSNSSLIQDPEGEGVGGKLYAE